MPLLSIRHEKSELKSFEVERRLRVGVLSNPRSGGNKKGGPKVRTVLAKWPETLHREAVNPHEVSVALSDFAANGVTLVVINGGDGTASAVLTAIGRDRLFPHLPLLALLCAGTTSMLARDVGISGSPEVALQRVLLWAHSPDDNLAVRSRPFLRVLRDTQLPPLYGMFFGAGAICQGIRAFHSRDNPMGWRGELMPALTMLRLLLSMLRNDQSAVPPLLTRTGLDGRPAMERSNLLVLVSTLERLFLGMHPYWGKEEGPLRYTAIDPGARFLLRVLPSMFRLSKNHYVSAEYGYLSHNVHQVLLDMNGEFTLDGELYEVGIGPVSITSAGTARFLVGC